MAAGVPIIDLDVVPTRGAAGERPLRRWLVLPRPALLLAVVMLALTALSAAAPPSPAMVHLLSAGGQPAAAFVLSPDSLYTASFGNNPNSESAVRGYDLADGSLRWATALPQNVQNLVYDGTAHVLMGRSGTEPKVTFLDADTGEVLWRDESPNTAVVTMAGGRVLMQTDRADGRRELRLLGGRTGRQVWGRVVDSGAYLGPDDVFEGPPTRLIAVDTAGNAVVLRYTDGAVLAEGNLDVRFGAQLDNVPGADFAGVSTVGDTLYVSRRDRGATTLTAWSVPSLRRLWEAAGGPAGGVLDCGIVLCIADDRQVTGVDPAGGAVRWQRRGLGIAFRNDKHTLYAQDQQDTPLASLLDPGTGAVLHSLGPTVRVGGVFLRYDTVIPGRAWVEAADPADGALHVLGAVDTAAPFGCAAEGPYLACPTTAGPTQVWRLPVHLT